MQTTRHIDKKNGWMDDMAIWEHVHSKWRTYAMYQPFLFLSTTNIMASQKITKLAGAKPIDEFELTIAQALIDLENNVPDLKKDLKPLTIAGAKEVIFVGRVNMEQTSLTFCLKN